VGVSKAWRTRNGTRNPSGILETGSVAYQRMADQLEEIIMDSKFLTTQESSPDSRLVMSTSFHLWLSVSDSVRSQIGKAVWGNSSVTCFGTSYLDRIS